ncbi:MAG TPA: hypothetical protein VEB03_02300, partial [Candidatus Nanoarchaeia archaeon]|nr:hypothetical protein [Candidatus Nanoarchaeia archaeon]
MAQKVYENKGLKSQSLENKGEHEERHGGVAGLFCAKSLLSQGYQTEVGACTVVGSTLIRVETSGCGRIEGFGDLTGKGSH